MIISILFLLIKIQTRVVLVTMVHEECSEIYKE